MSDWLATSPSSRSATASSAADGERESKREAGTHGGRTGESSEPSWTGRPESPAHSRGGWLRRFLVRQLPRALREGLSRRAEQEASTARGRERIVRYQTALFGTLLTGLEGAGWRDWLRRALPLRTPGPLEPPSRHLHHTPLVPHLELDLSLDRLAARGELGAVGVGGEIYAGFAGEYRRLAERLATAREYRAAAHVHSYLLGDHARAAAFLETGGFHLEAATVYYHLAAEPARAALALAHGGLWDPAARVFMDAGRFADAAKAWEEAGDAIQARAAWRKVGADLRESGRRLEAAEVYAQRLADPSTALDVLLETARAGGRDAVRALEHARELAAVGDAARLAHEIARLQASRLAELEVRPRRRSFLLALELVERLSTWYASARGRDRLAGTSVDIDAASIEHALDTCLDVYGRARGSLPRSVRAEIEPRLEHVADRAGRLLGDPWIVEDLHNWLTGAPAEPAAGDPRGNPGRVVTDIDVGIRITSSVLFGSWILAGGESGEIRILDEELRMVERLDTASGHAVTRLAASEEDIYAAVGSRVHHFALSPDSPELGGRAPQRALQIERTLPGAVATLEVLPRGVGVLRGDAHSLVVLDASHLRPKLEVLRLPRGRRLIGLDAHEDQIAILLAPRANERNEGRERGGGRDEVLVLRRRRRSAALEYREVERFDVEAERARRIAFVAGASDDALAIVGDERLTWLPSDRAHPSVHELEISSRDPRIPPARVAYLRRERALLVAYGDGSLERIDPRTRTREPLAAECEDPQANPLVALLVDEPRRAAWLVHASGRVRRVATH